MSPTFPESCGESGVSALRTCGVDPLAAKNHTPHQQQAAIASTMSHNRCRPLSLRKNQSDHMIIELIDLHTRDQLPRNMRRVVCDRRQGQAASHMEEALRFDLFDKRPKNNMFLSTYAIYLGRRTHQAGHKCTRTPNRHAFMRRYVI